MPPSSPLLSSSLIRPTPPRRAPTMHVLGPDRRHLRGRYRLHPQRLRRLGDFGAVQRLVHPLRPVLRPRPRPRHQGRQRHGLRPAAAGRSALRAGRPDQLHGADARHQSGPGADGVARHGRRRARARQPDHALRRPEPDLHLASVAPGLPARVRAGRRQAGRDRAHCWKAPRRHSPTWADIKAQAATCSASSYRRRRRCNVPLHR